MGVEKRGILKKKLNLERILVWGAAAAVLLSLSYLLPKGTNGSASPNAAVYFMVAPTGAIAHFVG